MLNKPRAIKDPAAGAASLILRIGVLVLAVGTPCGAVISRRSLFILMPIGAVLIVVGALLSPGGTERLQRHLRGVVGSPILLLGIFILLWAGLSLLWTPYVDPALERYFKTVGTIAVVALALAALPDHMRASNSNLIAIGTAAASLAIICIAIMAPQIIQAMDPDGSTLQRATIGVVVLLWPALAALILRERIASAAVVTLVTAVAVALSWMPLAMAALVVGMLTYAIAFSAPVITSRILGGLVAGLILLAPAIPLLLTPLLPHRIDPTGLAALIADWGTVVRGEGLRLVTGHGFDAAIRALVAGILPPRTPRGLLFDLWYELGVNGAVAAAMLAWLCFGAAGRLGPVLAPFMLAALGSVMTIAMSGLAGAQLWWVTVLSTAVLSCGIVLRGQFRTSRVRLELSLPPRLGV